MLALAHADVRRFLEIVAADVDLQGLGELVRPLVQAARLQRALLVDGGRGGGVLRAERDVLHEVLLVALRRLAPLLLHLVGLRRAQRIAALDVELGRLVRLPGQAEQARRFERVALLEEELRGLGRLVGGDVHVCGLLVVPRLEVVVRRLLEPADLLEGGGGRVVLLALEVRIRRFGQHTGFLPLGAGIDLNEQARALPKPGHFLGQRLADRSPVDGVDEVEQRDRIPRLVRLKRADQVQLDTGEALLERRPFGLGLLHAVLAEYAMTRGDHRLDRVGRERLGHRDQRHRCRIARSPSASQTESGSDFPFTATASRGR